MILHLLILREKNIRQNEYFLSFETFGKKSYILLGEFNDGLYKQIFLFCKFLSDEFLHFLLSISWECTCHEFSSFIPAQITEMYIRNLKGRKKNYKVYK